MMSIACCRTARPARPIVMRRRALSIIPARWTENSRCRPAIWRAEHAMVIGAVRPAFRNTGFGPAELGSGELVRLRPTPGQKLDVAGNGDFGRKGPCPPSYLRTRQGL